MFMEESKKKCVQSIIEIISACVRGSPMVPLVGNIFTI